MPNTWRSRSTSIRRRQIREWLTVFSSSVWLWWNPSYIFVFPRSSLSHEISRPREAAMLLARLANHRNPHIGRLALALLSTLVQSCGYPFHLQISTKEFLNELVRRFPERPPPFPGPVMQGILELINEWKEGICQSSRWKQDLGNIRDMHRLLTFKGYRFRERPRTTRDENATAVSVLEADRKFMVPTIRRN